MVSTNTFNAATVTTTLAPLIRGAAPVKPVAPAAAALAAAAATTTAAAAAAAAAASALHDVSVNGVAPATVADLLALGAARRAPAAPDAPAAAATAFTGHPDFDNDLAYFKGLLGARAHLEAQLRDRVAALRKLRARSNSLRKRPVRRSRKAPRSKAPPMAPKPDPPASDDQTVVTDAKVATQSVGTVSIGERGPDPWLVGPRGEFALSDPRICSSPVSMEEHAIDDLPKCGKEQCEQPMHGPVPAQKVVYHHA